tara:strand:- start:11781 stop:13580 length:1800 start_codon:yes stop_codon:yes gene_type:complete
MPLMGVWGCPSEPPTPFEPQVDAGEVFQPTQDAGALSPTPKHDAGSPPFVTDAGPSLSLSDEDGGGVWDAGLSSDNLCESCVRSVLYPEDWAPDTTYEGGLFLHDFSYAGYHQSEKDVPQNHETLDVFDVTDHGADNTGANDSSLAIQQAIDAASSNGGGLIFFPSGEYRCENNLLITHSNIVLRGHSLQDTKLFFTRSNNSSDASIRFRGTLTEGNDHLLLINGENRSHEVFIADASELQVGDDILVGWSITTPFIQEHGMTEFWNSNNNFPSVDLWRPFFRRVITSIDETPENTFRIGLDVPLRYPAKIRDAASLRKVSGHLLEVGIENLKLSNAIDTNAAWAADRVHLIEMHQVKNAWINHIKSTTSPEGPSSFHLQSSGILVKQSKNVTVAHSDLMKAQNRGAGGNGYLYEVMQSNEILFRDSRGIAGRHNFIQNWDFGTSGVVFLRTESAEGQTINSATLGVGTTAYSEFHHALAMANLIDDSFASDGWAAVNRRFYSSGAGTCATQTVFWNLRGDPGESGFGSNALLSFQHGMGYVIGTQHLDVQVSIPVVDITGRSSLSAPEDHSELIDEGENLYPPSLFEDQLTRRIGNTD